MLGYTTKEDLIGIKNEEVIAAEDYKKALITARRLLDHSDIETNLYFKLRRKSGEKIPVELSASVIKDYSNHPIGFMITTQDITERLKIEKINIQQQKDESISFMANTIAHDFNNILMIIAGNLSLLEIRTSIDKDHYLIKESFEAIQKAKKITNQLINFSNYENQTKKKENFTHQHDTVKNTFISKEKRDKTIEYKEDISQKRKKILIMEDNTEIQKILSRILVYLQVEVVIAKDGEECIEIYKKALETVPFDGIIMDYIIIGGMGAEKTIKYIHDIDPKAKVIVSSGNFISNYQSLGFIDQLQKPYQLKDIKKKIDLL